MFLSNRCFLNLDFPLLLRKSLHFRLQHLDLHDMSRPVCLAPFDRRRLSVEVVYAWGLPNLGLDVGRRGRDDYLGFEGLFDEWGVDLDFEFGFGVGRWVFFGGLACGAEIGPIKGDPS